jgi:N-acylneuraminate cytidylyltransferase
MVASGAPAPKTVVALVPARAGSKRVQHKNIRYLGGHPTIAYTIASARASGIFEAVVVSTDSPLIAEVAQHYGAEVPFLRPAEYATEKSPDIEWLAHTLGRLADAGRFFDAFSILRPTSPFRKAETIRRAWQQFLATPGVDSLRAIEKCVQHPYKMWLVNEKGDRMMPFVAERPADGGAPWHSRQYQALPPVYVQNASLEIAWTRVATELKSISGDVLTPFFTQGDEGFDINNMEDWWVALHMLESGAGTCPPVPQAPFPEERLRAS